MNFGKSSTLTRHLQTHWGKKPFKCPECSKGFLESATLVRHQHTYTGEKPYVCGDWVPLQRELHLAAPPSQPPGREAFLMSRVRLLLQ